MSSRGERKNRVRLRRRQCGGRRARVVRDHRDDGKRRVVFVALAVSPYAYLLETELHS